MSWISHWNLLPKPHPLPRSRFSMTFSLIWTGVPPVPWHRIRFPNQVRQHLPPRLSPSSMRTWKPDGRHHPVRMPSFPWIREMTGPFWGSPIWIWTSRNPCNSTIPWPKRRPRRQPRYRSPGGSSRSPAPSRLRQRLPLRPHPGDVPRPGSIRNWPIWNVGSWERAPCPGGPNP